MTRPRLSIIVVSYNTLELTRECLRSVLDETRKTAYELIVIDNASADGSAAMIRETFPEVRLIAAEKNLGFAGANNLAAQSASGELLLLLNPDTKVIEGGIDRLVEFARAEPEAGIWGGRTVFSDGKLNPGSCWQQPSVWSTLCSATGLSSLFRGSSLMNPEGMGGWPRDTQRKVDIVSGCFFLIRRELWDRLGGFDPMFFMYGEDADLCLRARRLGASPMVTPEATIVHYGGASERVRSDKLVRLITAKAQLIRRHWQPLRAVPGLILLSAWPLTRALAWTFLVLTGRRGAKEAAAQWWDVWRRRSTWLASAEL